MRDNDDINKLPPLVPSRDDMDSYNRSKQQRRQEIVRPGRGYSAEKVVVSSWPVRVTLTLLTLALLLAVVGAYYFYQQEYLAQQQEYELRIADLERRLAMVGDSSEESSLNMIERIDFNFSEIDKLWAARRVINTELEKLTAEVTKISSGQQESTSKNAEDIVAANKLVAANSTKVNALVNEQQQLTASVAALQTSINGLDSLRSEVEELRENVSGGGGSVADRLDRVDSQLESVNAHRSQINDSLFRLQERIEALQLAQQNSR